MKHRLFDIICDYYPILFILVTFSYCFPLFVDFSTLLNMLLLILGTIVFILNFKSIKICDLILEITLFILTTFSIIVNQAFDFSNLKLLSLLFLQLFVLLHYNQYSTKIDKNLITIFNSIIFVSFLTSIISLIICIGNDTYYLFGYKLGLAGDDLTGIYVHPNTAGFVAFISIVFSVFLYRDSSNRKKYFLFANGIIQTLVLYYSHSNAPILAVFVFLILYLLHYFFNYKKIRLFSINPIILFSFTDIIQKFANGRFEIWSYGFEIIKNHFFLGVSPAKVGEYAKYYGNIDGYSTIDRGGLHNSYIQLFAGTGFFCFLSMFILITKNIYTAFKNFDKYYIYIFFVFSVLIYSFFESKLFFQASLIPSVFWIILGLIGGKRNE